MTARIRSRPAVPMRIVGVIIALATGCAQVPTGSTAPGMFSLPETIEDRPVETSLATGDGDRTTSPDEQERRDIEIAENLRRGQLEAEAGRPDQAARFFERVLRDDPRNVEAHHRLAVLADEAGDFFAAERSYLAALEGRPHDSDLLNDLGYSYLLQQRYPECERVLRQVVSQEPTHERARANLALLYRSIGDEQRAMAVLRTMPARNDLRELPEAPTSPGRLHSPIVLTAGMSAEPLPLWKPQSSAGSEHVIAGHERLPEIIPSPISRKLAVPDPHAVRESIRSGFERAPSDGAAIPAFE